MKKALITGSLGFVGRYLTKELHDNGYEILGLDVIHGPNTIVVDLLDNNSIKNVIGDYQPQVIINLAGQANVGLSWGIPQKTIEINTIGAINILESVRLNSPKTKVVLIGSSDQYGCLKKNGYNVTENITLNPETPYAVSKKAQEDIARIYSSVYGLNVSMTRSFNHGGAGQKEGFIIPDFSAGIVRIERGFQDFLTVGNLDSKRDYTHVRDIVRAYRLIAEYGKSGEVYNVGSGVVHSGKEILESLRSMSLVDISVRQDKSKMRPSDTPIICCNHDKLTNDTGWVPTIPFDTILSDTLNYYRNLIK